MNTVTLNFRADGQQLVLTGSERFAANTVSYIRAAFELGDGWDGFDSIRAIWATDFAKFSTVLDPDGVCVVPWEVLKRVDTVMVNLVGSISDGEDLTDRLTTYKVKALDVNGCTNIDGSETAEITPSQFEQFVAIVKEEVGKVKDISDVKLNADYTLTFLFSDGTEWTTPIPIRGEQGAKGDTGNGISDIEKIGSQGRIDTYRITYTNGVHFDFEVTNGEKGEQGETGNGIESITLTATSGAVKTYTIAFTDGTSTTFDVTDGEVTNEVLDGATIVQTNTDKVPYLFRQSGGGVKVGLKESDKIVGGTVAWNQLVQKVNVASEVYGITRTKVADGDKIGLHYTGTSTSSTGFTAILTTPYVTGHKYLLALGIASLPTGARISPSSIDKNTSMIYANYVGTFGVFIASGTTVDFTVYPQVIDLTQMFGTTIADYIYSLEQASAGAGVAWFKKLFPKDYYEYNAGELISVSGLESHDTVGFNQWDEEWEVGTINDETGATVSARDRIRSKNFIPCLPSTNYYFKHPNSAKVMFYDTDETFIGGSTSWDAQKVIATPSNCRYMKFAMAGAYGTTYNHDICINLSWSGYRNGEYEPYEKHSYPLDNSLTLRGIPKLDSSNNLYYDGDEYASDGSVVRRYGVVDLNGTENWVYNAKDATKVMFTTSVPDSVTLPDNMDETIRLLASTLISVSARTAVSSSTRMAYQTALISDNRIYVVFPIDVGKTAADAKAWFAAHPATIVYELATPTTTETAEPYTNPQTVDPSGTEEYVTTSIVPVGHETEYPLTLIDTMPTANGTYTMSITVTNGKRTVNWA